MLSTAGNDYGKEGKDDQAPPAYESSFGALQSKKRGVRRVRFQDTDDNEADTVAADYSATDVSAIFPRSLASGEWGDELSGIIAEIEAAKKTLPKFYAAYCTGETAASLDAVLSAVDVALSGDADAETMAGLKSQLEEAAGNMRYKSDSKIAQVYVATKKNESGDSYGTTLTKAIGYVPAQLVVVSTDGEVMAGDLSWAGQIKVRGNSTASGAKRPYNMKFSGKVDLFGFGKAKKWTLLADMYDPSLMRNWTALTLGKKLGLEATMDCKRVEVWVDGDYRGVYLLTEKIEADTNRVDINTKNGDFLIELTQASENEEGNIYFKTSMGINVRLREPENEAKIEAVKSKFDDFEAALKSGSWEQLIEYIDLESFVSFVLLNEFMGRGDFSWPKSVYFYYKNGKFYAGPAWDFDNSSGNNTSAERLWVNTHHYKYLCSFPEFQLALSRKLAEMSESGLLEQIYSEGGSIDKDAVFYSEALSKNFDVWSKDVARILANTSWLGTMEATYEGNVLFFKSWLAARYDWMTDYFLARTYISSDTFPDPALREYIRTFDTNSDSFLSTAEKSAVTSLDMSGLGLTSLNLTGLEVFPNAESLDISGNPALSWVNTAKFPGLTVIHDDGLALIDAVPSFSAHSLVLSGQIGVDFYVDIPKGTDTDGAYADFTVNRKTGNPSMFSNAEEDSEGRYMFTCYINSVQMADTITAAFRFGDGEIVSQDYCAKDYLDRVIASSDEFSGELVSLVKAIKDYGHYVQIPLADYNGWKIGVKHAEMDCAGPEIDADSADVKAALEGYRISRDIAGSGIGSMTVNLELESETTLNIWLIPSADYTGNVAAYLDDSGENMAVQQSDGSYLVTINGISAHKLGDMYTIHVEAGKSFDIEASALSYADLVMKSETASDDLKRAVIALYKYYTATMNYRHSAGYDD